MKLPIQKFMMLFAAAISLLQIPISHANGLDARLRDDMQAKHYEPGGKYHLFGNARGSVKNRVYAVQTFDATAVSPVLPITHERTGFEGIIGYETHFSGHGHEVHSPFDHHDSKSTSDFSGGVDGGFTVYQLHRTGSEIHPEDGYDGPQGSDYPPPGGARDIYSYYVKGTSTKTKTNIVPQAPFSDRWLKENAGAASGFFSRADEAGKLIWESDPNKNWWANRMDDIRGIVQGAVNPFLMGFQGVGIGAITDSAVSPVTDTAAQQTLQGINHLGNLSPEAQLAAATALQDSAFAVKDGINSARQWADAHPNITATAQTALSAAEAAGTVWRGKKVELNPTKWDWVKNTGYKTPAARPMQTLDGEMAGGNKPVVKSIRPTTRDELRQALQEQGFRRTGSDAAQYETWKGPDGVKIDIRPNGEVIRTQRVPRTDGVQGKYPQRQDYEGNPLPNNHHHSGYFVK
ncbi:polymorphic toxin MafB class 3 [Neisseria meningitidis]|uniref:polymorphic toxin MafB class 3 n=1 Tax=Neisseria meningitidis TaxID=487 RepID=UPI000E579665|nr:polymorphic toxin MafB class 3 [Neisseria meningitidis]MCL4983346.1 polymorphic toxin MafB class 3 [Neisseria meningitidis]MCL5821063.1 polymorphic toxin MafB class 3 [Neisseria meningitidis]MCL5841190.1 polymorphic toxin MafB class 3 [Neisseria meningitidis]MCL5859371.1 polymorphic toxin MafB class 3 [Neisseria meningitidis]MCL5915265.1 polymorphic toxin MafB class 3 [Neisseria meningitidis]